MNSILISTDPLRQKLDLCLRFVAFLGYELKTYDLTALEKDGTLSYVTMVISLLRRRLLAKCVSEATQGGARLICEGLSPFEQKVFGDFLLNGFPSFIMESSASLADSEDRRKHDGWKSLKRKIGLETEQRKRDRRKSRSPKKV